MSSKTIRKKACVEVVRKATCEDQESARRNRDPLSLMSSSQRERYVGQYVVMVRLGESPGSVVGDAATLEDAVRIAQKLPGYRPEKYWVRFIPPVEGSE